MRLLILTQHFPPETMATGRRAFDLARAFASVGHRVTVIAGLPNHPSSLGQTFCQGTPKEVRAAEGYRVLRVPVFRSSDPQTLKRLLTYTTFMLAAACRALAQPRPDAIIAVSPLPTGLAALFAHRWHRTPLVFDLQDIWPDSALAVGTMKHGWGFRTLQHLERLLYGRAAAVVAITQGFKEYLVNRGVPNERIAVIPNGVDWETFVGAQPHEELKRAGALRDRFVVGYIGNIGLAQQLETVLDAAGQLRDEPVTFLILGEGVDKQRLQGLAQTRGLTNVQFLRGVPRREVPSVLATCDALLAILRDHPLFKITIPSKLYEYMAAGKPILCSVEGEAASLVAEAKCGLPVHPSEGKALAEGIRILLRDPSRRRAMGEAGAVWARMRFARSSVMGDYVNLVEGLLGQPGSIPAKNEPEALEALVPKQP